MPTTVVGLFRSMSQAESAIQDLITCGIPLDQTRVIAAGAAKGAVLEDLEQAGVSEDDALLFYEGTQRGNALVIARADNDLAGRAADILDSHGAEDVEERAKEWRLMGLPEAVPETSDDPSASATNGRTAGLEHQRSIPVVEEQLEVGKRQVERGGVRVSKHLVETPVEQTVNLREERVNVERRPVDREASEADFQAFQEGIIELVETAEEPVISKRSRVVEEVVITRDVRERQETIRDTVRRTDVKVEKTSRPQAEV